MSDGKVISFINMKGGVGKTTLCREIGYTLNKQFKKSILFIDIDPQANLTQSLFEKYKLLPENLYADMEEGPEKEEISICNLSINTLLNGSETLPSIDSLVVNLKSKDEDKHQLALVPGDLRTVFLERSNKGSIAENSVDKFIEKRNLRSIYDYIFIDCPPTYSFYTTAAFNASDYYIVPVAIDPYSVLGIDLLEQVVAAIKENDFRRFESKKLENMGIIFNPIIYTSGTTAKRQFTNQKRLIKNSKSLKKYNLYYFETKFETNSNYRAYLDYFSLDNKDQKHNSNIIAITQEFKDRIDFLEGAEKKNARKHK